VLYPFDSLQFRFVAIPYLLIWVYVRYVRLSDIHISIFNRLKNLIKKFYIKEELNY
jgi:hypothetical protein